MIETKICIKCEVSLPIDSFHKSKTNKFGVKSVCKICTSTYDKVYRESNKEKLLSQTLKYREVNREAINKKHRENHKIHKEKRNNECTVWRNSNKEKCTAHDTLNHEIRSGRLIRITVCEVCGESSKLIEAHHTDYSKPLLVDWLCRKCHRAVHAKG